MIAAITAGGLTACAILLLVPARTGLFAVLGDRARGRRPGRPGARLRSPRRVAGTPPSGSVPPAVVADLLAALLVAGLPPEAALALVHRLMDAAGLARPTGMSAVHDALRLASRTGLAPAGLVRAAAVEQRRAQASEHTLAARRLGVLVVLPVGLCLLPAFVLVTVVPMVLGLVSA